MNILTSTGGIQTWASITAILIDGTLVSAVALMVACTIRRVRGK